MIRVRKTQAAFGRGEVHFLVPANRAILAYLLTYGDETVLVFNNLSPDPQVAQLDLAAQAGAQPIDLFTGAQLAVITPAPYQITLEGYGYRWLRFQA